MPDMDASQTRFSADAWIASGLLGTAEGPGQLHESQWRQIEQTADIHGVVPLLLHCLSRRSDWKAFPAGFRNALTQPNYQFVAWDMRWQVDLGQLLDRFEQAEIPYLLIKGAGLAFTHYEHSYLRVRCDTDILFPDKSVFEQAWSLLESMGFTRSNTLSGEFVGYQYCCYRPHELGFSQVLDCHVRINDYQFYADAFTFDELYAQSVSIPQLAESARTPGVVHALLTACLHRVATIPHSNADRLIWLYDMYLLADSFNDDHWAEFLHLARAKQLCGTCVHSLDAARVYFPISAPAGVMSQLRELAEKEPFKPGHEMKRWRYYFHVFSSTPGVGKKAKLLKEHFFPPAEYLLEKYQTSNRLLLPILYVRRVFGGLGKYF